MREALDISLIIHCPCNPQLSSPGVNGFMHLWADGRCDGDRIVSEENVRTDPSSGSVTGVLLCCTEQGVRRCSFSIQISYCSVFLAVWELPKCLLPRQKSSELQGYLRCVFNQFPPNQWGSIPDSCLSPHRSKFEVECNKKPPVSSSHRNSFMKTNSATQGHDTFCKSHTSQTNLASWY